VKAGGPLAGRSCRHPQWRASPFHDESKKRSVRWGAGLPICLFTQRRTDAWPFVSYRPLPGLPAALASPRRPPLLACLPAWCLPPLCLWALARGLCLRGRHVPEGQDRSLADCAARMHARSRPVGSGQVSQWAVGMQCNASVLLVMHGWVDGLAGVSSETFPFPSAFAAAVSAAGAGSERCGEPGVSAHRPVVNGDAMVGGGMGLSL
jgi:hypothetical protein